MYRDMNITHVRVLAEVVIYRSLVPRRVVIIGYSCIFEPA